MKVRKTMAGGICVALVALALSACGSSSSSTSAGSGGSAAAAAVSTPAPTGNVFKLGALCSCTGTQAAALGRVGDVSKAWADSVNAAGGINGHQVSVTVMDDGGSPAKALQNVKQLIQDGSQAIVSDGSLADNGFAPYVATAGVPVVGGFSPSIPFLTNPDFYAEGANLPVQTVGVAALAKAAGKKKLGVMYCSETPLCAQLIPIAKGAAALSGLGLSTIAISSTAPNYTAPCLSFKSSGVDALFVADNGGIVQRVVAACASQGYKPAIVSETTTADGNWLKDPNFEGALLSSSNAPYTDQSIPGVKGFLDAITKYAPGLQSSPQFSYDTIYPWIAGKLFEAAAQAGNLTPSSTPAQVKAAMYKVKGATLDGLSAPLSFTPGAPAFVPCYYGVTIKGGQYQSLDGGKPRCLTPTQAKALVAGLKAVLGH